MRGTPLHRQMVDAGGGIIPAYAGNTFGPFFISSFDRDHPRVCGEHMLRERRIVWQAGSSPRMRGTLSGRRYLFSSPGIIPAYAGNTDGVHTQVLRHRDHPRVCGEHQLPERYRYLKKGSSPRMRGTRFIPLGFRRGGGIIPAYAGNTYYPVTIPEDALGSSPRMRGTRNLRGRTSRRHGIIPAYAGNTLFRITGKRNGRDHPRVCGEHQNRP